MTPPTLPTINLDNINQRLHVYGAPFYGILRTAAAIADWPIDIDPDFQRGHVWTQEQQEQFVGHLLQGGQVQQLLVNEGPDGRYRVAQLVDGKQRITACLRWSQCEIPARLYDGRTIWRSQLDAYSVTACNLHIGLQYGMVRMTRAEVLDMYLRLNCGGVVHSPQEIERVRQLLAQERQQ